MRKVYIIRETKKVSDILDNTYNEVLAALRYRNPKAQRLTDDDEMSQLHDMLALLRLGHIKVSYAEDDDGRFMFFEIKMDAPTSS